MPGRLRARYEHIHASHVSRCPTVICQSCHLPWHVASVDVMHTARSHLASAPQLRAGRRWSPKGEGKRMSGVSKAKRKRCRCECSAPMKTAGGSSPLYPCVYTDGQLIFPLGIKIRVMSAAHSQETHVHIATIPFAGAHFHGRCGTSAVPSNLRTLGLPTCLSCIAHAALCRRDQRRAAKPAARSCLR